MTQKLKVNSTLYCMNWKYNLLTATFLTLGSFSLHAQTKHTVKAKETLFSISKKYEITIDDIKKWNRLKGTDISVGQVLLVSDPFINQKKTVSLEQPKESAEIHIVKKGESLFSIAKRYKIAISDLKQLNGLKSNNLAIGQKLIVKLPETSNLLTSKQSEFLSLETFKRHQVSTKENLNDILERYKISLSELQALNPDLDLKTLYKGQELNVIENSRIYYPNPYLVKSALHDTTPKTPTFVYTESETGNVSTSGELISEQQLTLAHRSLPFGAIVLVTNKTTGKSVIARVNDRTTEDAVKLSIAIKKAIDFDSMAQHEVSVERL